MFGHTMHVPCDWLDISCTVFILCFLINLQVFDSSKTAKSTKCVHAKEMHFKRSRPGSCLLGGHRGRRFAGLVPCCLGDGLYSEYIVFVVSVCGGIMYGKGTNSVELYDLEKDKWTVHSSVLQYEHLHPTMWTLDDIS